MNIVKKLHQKDEKERNIFIMSNVVAKSKFRVGYFIWNLIGWPAILAVIQSVISGLLCFIPVIGWIAAIVIEISLFFEILGCILGGIKLGMSHIHVTDTGVVGRRSDKFRSFKLSYDEIEQITDTDGITIYVKQQKSSGKKKKKMIKIENVANEETILQAVRYYSKEAKKAASGGNKPTGGADEAEGVTVVSEMDEILKQSLAEEAAKQAAKEAKAAAKAEKAAAKAAKTEAEDAELEQMLDDLAKESEDEKK